MTGAPQYHDNADDPLTIDEYLYAEENTMRIGDIMEINTNR